MVVYAGSATAAVEQVAADTREREGELSPRPVVELLTEPRLLGARVAPCQGPPADSAELRRAIAQAADSLHTFVRPSDAWGQLAHLPAERLACLRDPVTAGLGVDLFFLMAKVAWALEDEASARAALRRVVAFAPDFRIPPTDAQDAAPALEEERTALLDTPGGTIRVIGGDDASLWIDGRSQALAGQGRDLTAGAHIVQVLQPSVWSWEVWVSPGDELVVVLPERVDGRLLAGVEDERGRADLAAVFTAAGLDERRGVYVTGATSTWAWDPSSGRWTSSKRALGNRLAWPLALGGAALATGGGVVAAFEGVRVADYHDQVDGLTASSCHLDEDCSSERYQELVDQARPHVVVGNVAVGVTAVGAGAALAGVVLGLQDARRVRVLAAPLPDGGMVMVGGEL